VLSVDDFFRKIRVFQGPETEKTRFKFIIVSAGDIVLTIGNGNQIIVCSIDINASNRASFSNIIFKFKEILKTRLVRRGLFFFLVFFNSFLFFIFLFTESKTLFLSILFIVITLLALITKINRRIVLVKNVLLVVLTLSQQSFNDSDCFKHGVGKINFNILNVFLNAAKITGDSIRTNRVGLSDARSSTVMVRARLVG